MKIRVLNHLIVIFLCITFISGFLVKMMPGMVFGILHGISSVVLLICALFHVAHYKTSRVK